MYRFDSEDVLDMVEQLCKEKLNGKIAEIESQKAANGRFVLKTPLAPVASDAYYRQTWDDGILMKPVAIFYGIESLRAIDGGNEIAEEFKVFVEVNFVDNGLIVDGARRVARYSRAIKEIFVEAFRLAPESSRIKIEEIVPASVKFSENSSEVLKVGGITLTVSIC